MMHPSIKSTPAVAGVAQWLSTLPCTERSQIAFLVRAHGQAVGSVPGQGGCKRQQVDVAQWRMF